jgi:hypothetical protein
VGQHVVHRKIVPGKQTDGLAFFLTSCLCPLFSQSGSHGFRQMSNGLLTFGSIRCVFNVLFGGGTLLRCGHNWQWSWLAGSTG